MESGRAGLGRIGCRVGSERIGSDWRSVIGDRRREIGDQFGLDCVGSVRFDLMVGLD